MVPWVGVACTGKRKCYNLSFRVGFAQYGKLISDAASMRQLSGRARLAQSRFCPDYLPPEAFSALRQAREFHGPGLPHTVALLAALPGACMVVGNTFAIPD